MSKKHAGYVFIPVKPETRAALNKLKSYGDTYDSIINLFLRGQIELKLEDYAAQNIDVVKDENG